MLLPERNILSWVEKVKQMLSEYARAVNVSQVAQIWLETLERGAGGDYKFFYFPLRIWTYIGVSVSALSLIYAMWMIIDNKLMWGNPVHSLSLNMTAILFLGGIQLIGIGIMGSSGIGRVYTEVKQEPLIS